MKKILFAAVLAVLLPLFVSCGKHDNTSKDSFKEPRFVQSAGQLIPASGDLKSVDFSESGVYVVGENVAGAVPAAWHPGTKADTGEPFPEIKYIAGEYDVNGYVYNLKGWGTLEFNNSTSGEVELKYTASGKSTVTVQARFIKSIANSDIFRSWRVDKTRVRVGSAAADFAGCNFKEIAKFFEDNGHDIQDDIPADARVNTISITGADRIIIVYSNGDVDLGSCFVSGNSIDYYWQSPGMGYSFETGHATFEFMDGKCIFSIDARFNDNTSGVITLVLSDIE